LLTALVLVFATWANYRHEGKVSFRVFDSTWWGVGRDTSQPYVDSAKGMASSAYEKVWGKDGLVDQADAWLKRDDPALSEPVTTGTVEGAVDERSAHEHAFAEAQDRFEQGLVTWRSTKPVQEGASRDLEAVKRAKADFKHVEALLDKHIPAYNSTPGKNLRVLKDAEDLQALNRRMLEQIAATS
jgi:hypothetical protein